MKWAILQWHPQGAYWVKGKSREGDRAKVLTFKDKEAAEYAASTIAQYNGHTGGLEVLEYNI